MKPEAIEVPVYQEMAQYCEDHNVVSFAVLCEIAAKEHPLWLKALTRPAGTKFMRTYIRRRYIDQVRNNEKTNL